MSQFSGSTQAALDYNSTIIGALELSERKWVLAVQLPGVSRYSRLCAKWLFDIHPRAIRPLSPLGDGA